MEQNYSYQQQQQQQQQLYDSSLLNPYSSFSYATYPNPNPNSLHPTADAGIIRPPGTDGYDHHHHHHYGIPPDPQAAAAPPPPPAQSYYYYGVGGDLVHHQYAPPPPEPFSYAATTTKVGTARTYADLETKKRKVIQGGASADSVRVCTICNVVCNSDKVFASHIAGENHVLKATGRAPMGIKPKVPAYFKALHSIKKATHPTLKSAAKKASKSLITFVHSTYCGVCKIDCNSQEVFNSHKMGKKHMKNVQKLQGSVAPKPASAHEKKAVQKDASVVGKSKASGQQQKTMPTKEDLESKKQKVLNGGAAAGLVRVCGLCNVVCNSEPVFNSHILGQKHFAKLNKQQATPV